MRILFALNYYYPYLSGLSEYVRLLAEGLARRGCAVTVLTGRHENGLAAEEVRDGVRIVRAGVLLKLHKGYLSPDLIAAFRRLVREASVAHLNTPMLEAGLLAWLTPRSTPLVVSHHCDIVVQNRGSMFEAAGVAAVKASARAALARASRIAVTSDDYARGSPSLRGYLPKCTAIPPPDNAPEAAVPDRPRGKRIGFLGRFVAEKGIGVLLAAIPIVLREIPDARFVLAGNYASVAGGSQFSRLKDRIDRLGESVEIPGPIPGADLAGFYRSLDVFVLPSVDSYEAFGIVQLEAMKAGVPVVASDMRGVRVPIRRTGGGILVPPGGEQALARAIVEILTTPKFSPKEVARAAWAEYPKERPAEQALALYEELLHGGAA